MKIKVLAFGVARDIIGSSESILDFPELTNTDQLRIFLNEKYPELGRIASYALAVNLCYAVAGAAILEGDEVAIIPPVSGG